MDSAKPKAIVAFAATIMFASVITYSAQQRSSSPTAEKREPLKIARIYADPNGDTHWETLDILNGVAGGPLAGSGPTETLASVGLPLTGKLTFHRIAGNLVIPNPPDKPHFAPYRTWIFVLS